MINYYVTADGGSARAVYAAYISRANGSLGVLCVRSEAGHEAFVVRRAGRGWRYVTSGPAGRVGNSADRQLERAC